MSRFRNVLKIIKDSITSFLNPFHFAVLIYSRDPEIILYLSLWGRNTHKIYTQMYYLGFSREAEIIVCVYVCVHVCVCKIYHEELAHAIMKTDKAQDLWLIRWRPRRADGLAPV